MTGLPVRPARGSLVPGAGGPFPQPWMKLSPEATAAKDPASQVIGAFAGGDGMTDTYFLIFLRNGEVLQGHTRFARQFRLDPSGGFIPVLRELKSW